MIRNMRNKLNIVQKSNYCSYINKSDIIYLSSFWREIEKPIISYINIRQLLFLSLINLKLKEGLDENRINWLKQINSYTTYQEIILFIKKVYEENVFENFSYSFKKWNEIVNDIDISENKNELQKNSEHNKNIYENEFKNIEQRFESYKKIMEEMLRYSQIFLVETFPNLDRVSIEKEYYKLYKNLLVSFNQLNSVINFDLIENNKQIKKDNFYLFTLEILNNFKKLALSNLLHDEKITSENKENVISKIKNWQINYSDKLPTWYIIKKSDRDNNNVSKFDLFDCSDNKFYPVIWTDSINFQELKNKYKLNDSAFIFNENELNNSSNSLNQIETNNFISYT